MAERDGYIPGVPCWIDTSQPDPEAAVDFYSGLFGWDFEDVMPPGTEGKYYSARIRGKDVAAVSSIPEGAPPMATWNTYVWVDSADDTAAKVRDAGGQVLTEPFDVTNAGRMAVFADPEGAVFCVWQAKEHKGAQIVNEHGSLNFNDLHTRDPERAKAFYGAVFGWQTFELGGGFQTWTLPGYGDYLQRDDPELRERLAEAGGSIVSEPFDVMDAGRMAVFTDPEGAVFSAWQAKQHRGARIVNEHGSLNFNDLNTRDPEGAKAFYGAVFGWDTLALGDSFTAWTLPGYGDHLAKSDPGIRERLAESGGPEGFEDVVASLVPIPDDQPDTPPHWGITFAVDDADEAARKATELGGTVVLPPTDLPWVRMTVITDPQGATFVASKFVPENANLNASAEAQAGA